MGSADGRSVNPLRGIGRSSPTAATCFIDLRTGSGPRLGLGVRVYRSHPRLPTASCGAVGASKTKTFLGERYRRIARRRGKKRAIVAVGRSILVIVWHLLGDDTARFNDLGPGYYDSLTDQPRT